MGKLMYYIIAMDCSAPGTDVARMNASVNVGNFAMILPHSDESEEHPDSTINKQKSQGAIN